MKLIIEEETLMQIFDLIEFENYHLAYKENLGEYYTMLFTNDNGNMLNKDIKDIYFDCEIV